MALGFNPPPSPPIGCDKPLAVQSDVLPFVFAYDTSGRRTLAVRVLNAARLANVSLHLYVTSGSCPVGPDVTVFFILAASEGIGADSRHLFPLIPGLSIELRPRAEIGVGGARGHG